MQIPRDEMIAFIDQYRDCFSVECICRIMREHMVGGFLTPCGYWATKTRKVSVRRLKDALLIEEIVKVFNQNYRVYGIRKIWHAMRRAGFAIGWEQTGRLMRLAGTYGAHRGRKPVTTRPSPPGYTPGLGSTPVRLQCAEPAVGCGYHLCQNFVGFRVHSFCYKRVFAQDYGLGYQVNYAPEALPLKALKQAISCAKDDLAGLIHHVDHGSQYVSIRYSQRLTDVGIRSSTGTIGDSYGNALAKTGDRLYKTELICSQTRLMYRSRMSDPELGVVVESPASPRIARLFHSRGSDNPI